MEITRQMLEAAMREAVAQGLLKKIAPLDTYEHSWSAMRKVLEAALRACDADTAGTELSALENLREVAGMNCEQLPAEVREALHKVPDIGKTHRCAMSKRCDDCGQCDDGQTGEYPCPKCGLPRLHDAV